MQNSGGSFNAKQRRQLQRKTAATASMQNSGGSFNAKRPGPKPGAFVWYLV
jgi:hypothetical protein